VESNQRFLLLHTLDAPANSTLIGPGNCEPVEMLVFGEIWKEIVREEKALFCGAGRRRLKAGGAWGAGCGGDPEGWDQ
jgi:hypothetical protein